MFFEASVEPNTIHLQTVEDAAADLNKSEGNLFSGKTIAHLIQPKDGMFETQVATKALLGKKKRHINISTKRNRRAAT